MSTKETKTELTEERLREIARDEIDNDKKKTRKLLGDILRIGFKLPVKKTKNT